MNIQSSRTKRLILATGLLALGFVGAQASFGQVQLNISFGIPVAPPPPPPPPPPLPAVLVAPPPQVSFEYFYDQLSPYGNWVQMPGYGWVWRPNVVVSNPSWRPYGDQGQWVYTSAGLYWRSEYPWGDIPFHYGRWTYSGLGWVWVPAYNWAPAWVSWRHADGCTGWAPLSPAAVFVAGVGLEFNGRVALDIDFGIPAQSYVFVSYDHFWDHGYRGAFLPRERVAYFYGHSEIHNGYHFEGGQIRVEGIGRERLAAVTHHEIRPVDARSFRAQQERAHFSARRADPVVRHFAQAHPNLRAEAHARAVQEVKARHETELSEKALAEKERAAHERAGSAEHPGAKPEERENAEKARHETELSEKSAAERERSEREKAGSAEHPGAKPAERAAKPGEKPAAKPKPKPKPKPGEKPGPEKDKQDQQR
jgi:hypothetical protein